MKNMGKPKTNKSNQKRDKQKPVLQFSVLCDGVAHENKKKPVFIGVFSNFVRTGVMPQFVIVNRWIYGIGEFTQKIIIRSSDLKKEVAKLENQKFILETEISGADLASGFVNVNFEKPGVYWIEVYLDDNLVLSYPLPVYQQS